jgi:hypothetical protein
MELLMTIGQSLVGMIFLMNMALSWWEAGALFGLWAIQFVFSPIQPGPGLLAQIAGHVHEGTTYVYLLWFGVEVVRIALGKRKALAFHMFAEKWRTHVRKAG